VLFDKFFNYLFGKNKIRYSDIRVNYKNYIIVIFYLLKKVTNNKLAVAADTVHLNKKDKKYKFYLDSI
jgi:hypothetical protein